VSALQKRLGSLGVDLDISLPASAVFDIAVEVGDSGAHQTLADLLPEAGSFGTSVASGHSLITGLNVESAQKIWSTLARTSAKVRILNRDFQRFDVKLEAAPKTAAMIELLITTTGMNEGRAAESLKRLPFVLVENIRGGHMLEILDAVRARGGVASGQLLPLMSFGLALKPGGDRDAAHSWIEVIAGREAARKFSSLDSSSQELTRSSIPGPLTKTQARWLQHQLRSCAISSQLFER
jgi:hypothetical protein